MGKLAVISLGGSLIMPGEVDVAYLRRFRRTVLRLVGEGYRFILVCGGGAVCRKYQRALELIRGKDHYTLDMLGIYATYLNAKLVQLMFSDVAEPEIVRDPTKPKRFAAKVLVASGWKPGWSTDYVAAVLARRYGAREVINLSDIAHVYSADPKRDPSAKRYRRLTWDEYIGIIGQERMPGMNTPFDPVAAMFCRQHRLRAVTLDGKRLVQLARHLKGERSAGTLIG
ncbi:UMP kinase [Candidatus Woesearchaeota archaeon]|nr:UMP kinase [Candidatus Woesearchaeota archaeon]